MADSDCTARGLLMLRLSLIPTFFMEDTLDMDTSDMPDSDTMDTDTADTSTANRLHQDISVNHRLNLGQKWINYQFEVPFTSAAVSVLP